MPRLGVKPAGQRAAMADDPHPDPGADRDIDEVAKAPRRPRLAFRQRGGNDVGAERHRASHGQRGDQVGALPAGFGGREDLPEARVVAVHRDRSEAGNAKRVGPPLGQPRSNRAKRIARASSWACAAGR